MPAPLMDPHLGAAIYGDPVYLGTIAATTAQDNGDTASSFNASGEALKGKLLLLQPDAACYVRQVAASGDGVTSTNGVKVAADAMVYMNMRSSKGFVSVLPVTGTVNLRVFEMNG